MTPETAAAPVTFTVDPWDPGYGLAFSEDLDGGTLGESSAELNLDLELPPPSGTPSIPTRYPACCDGAARMANVTVERGMFTTVAEATDITTRHARYPVRLASSGEPDQLSLALQQRLTEAEVQLALTFRAQNPAGDDLLVVDGPLRGRTHLDRTVGGLERELRHRLGDQQLLYRSLRVAAATWPAPTKTRP